VSIVRIGLSETKHFAEGYQAIFRKKKARGAKATKSVNRRISKRRAKNK